jgi:hypothetical protein
MARALSSRVPLSIRWVSFRPAFHRVDDHVAVHARRLRAQAVHWLATHEAARQRRVVQGVAQNQPIQARGVARSEVLRQEAAQ